jgi:hypothetical protein
VMCYLGLARLGIFLWNNLAALLITGRLFYSTRAGGLLVLPRCLPRHLARLS